MGCFGSVTAERLVETDSCGRHMSYWSTDMMPTATDNAGPLHEFLFDPKKIVGMVAVR